MQRREILPLVITAAILIGIPALVLGYEYVIRPAQSPYRVVRINASTPENGGFGPDAIRINTGETVILRFASRDVTHGVAIGPGLGVDLGQIDPGHSEEVTLTFEEPGRYTYYCNTWCSNDHWRMRGVIEVVDPAQPELVPSAQSDPVIEALSAEGVDIDAVHETSHEPGSHNMDSDAGARLLPALTVPAELTDVTWLRTHTPNEVFDILRAANPDTPEEDMLNAAAALWIEAVDQDRIAEARSLYDKNCAACHGTSGGGDGVATVVTDIEPTAFSDIAYMFGRRSDVLYAKIRRGGMGTDMPNWGTVFTPEETWGLVDYLWLLAFGQ